MTEGNAPTSAKEATITLATVAVGYAKGIKIGISAGLTKDYSLDSKDPAILEQANRSYPVSIDKLFIDSTHVNQVLAGTAIDLKVTPSGGVNYTVDDVVLNNWELTLTDAGALLEKVSGEGASLTVSA